MRRLAMAGAAALAGLALAAPGPKDPPKKGLDLAGEWEAETSTVGGRQTRHQSNDLRHTFATDGRWAVAKGGAVEARGRYEADPAASPAALDIRLDPPCPDNPVVIPAIAKVDGDTLTVCYVVGETDRPKVFESVAGTRGVLIVFKRVKKKE
jgi:uncharacterized protein (TIGR03067 family)